MVSVWYAGTSWWQRPDGYFSHRRLGQLLHRRVFEDNFGPVPDGYCVHHKDHDRTNNDPSNLSVMPAGEHTRHHNTGAVWSEERRQEQRERFMAFMASRPAETLVCVQCRQPYEHRSITPPGGFCGTRCMDLYRRPVFAGEERECAQCGSSFDAIRPVQRFCSARCNRAYQTRRPPVDRTPKPCLACGTSFTPKRNNAKYCSRPCAVKGARKAPRKIRGARAGVRPDG